MFRFVKALNGNAQADVHLLKCGSNTFYVLGEALVCTGGTATSPSATTAPDYIALTRNYTTHHKKLDAIVVTENSVFKVEYTGNMTPYVGMPVGLATYMSKIDAVTYNTNGKGTVLGVSDDGKYVYVRFRK